MKYYAVKKGRKTGIFYSWDECKSQVTGFSDAKYKSFDSEEEAKKFLEDSTSGFEKTEIEAYVDGSYDESLGKYAYGCVILCSGQVIKTINGSSCDEKYIEMRNVAGELEASVQAIKWAMQNKYKSIRIYHDYEGIASWAKGEWSTNRIGTREYVSFIQNCSKKIKICFTKVKGHSGQKYNEMADKLAKEGLHIKKIEDCSSMYKEFMVEYEEKNNQVSFILNEILFTEKSVIGFVKWLLKKKGYKKVTNLKMQFIIQEGYLEAIFDAANISSEKMYIKICDLEEKNVIH